MACVCWQHYPLVRYWGKFVPRCCFTRNHFSNCRALHKILVLINSSPAPLLCHTCALTWFWLYRAWFCASVSGLSGTKEVAQSQVLIGMGLLAGSTVMLLTLLWGSCVVVGKCDLLENSTATDGQDTKGFSLFGMLHAYCVISRFHSTVERTSPHNRSIFSEHLPFEDGKESIC